MIIDDTLHSSLLHRFTDSHYLRRMEAHAGVRLRVQFSVGSLLDVVNGGGRDGPIVEGLE